MAGSRYGSVQDPRVVRIGSTYYMTYAFQPYTWSINPTGVGVSDGYETSFPGIDGDPSTNQTRTRIAVSDDRLHWSHLPWVNDLDVEDRDILLSPQKSGVPTLFCAARASLWVSCRPKTIILASIYPGHRIYSPGLSWNCSSNPNMPGKATALGGLPHP